MYRSIPGLKFNELPHVEEITQSYVIATQDPETQILYKATIEEVVNSALGDAIIDDVGDGTVKGAIFYLSQQPIQLAESINNKVKFEGTPSESINLSIVGTNLKITIGNRTITVPNVTVSTAER